MSEICLAALCLPTTSKCWEFLIKLPYALEVERVYSTLSPPSGRQRRWLRHLLLAHSPSGIRPVPLHLWFTLPEGGAVDPYRMGAVRAFVLRQIAPRDFNEKEIDGLRLAYCGDDELFEALFQEWMKSHLDYLAWYARMSMDPTAPGIMKTSNALS